MFLLNKPNTDERIRKRRIGKEIRLVRYLTSSLPLIMYHMFSILCIKDLDLTLVKEAS